VSSSQQTTKLLQLFSKYWKYSL